MKYFSFLVKNKDRTIYYFEYRDSLYISEIMKHDAEAGNTYFKNFVNIFYALDGVLHIYDKINPDYLWTYILDTSGIFAKRINAANCRTAQRAMIQYTILFLTGFQCYWDSKI